MDFACSLILPGSPFLLPAAAVTLVAMQSLPCERRVFPVVVIDNLTTGFRTALPEDVAFEEGDVGDEVHVSRVLRQYEAGADHALCWVDHRAGVR